MLSSEFQDALGALVRQLQLRIAEEPALQQDGFFHEDLSPSALISIHGDLERAIIRLVALRLSLT